jgi:hypothetical protein
MSRFVVHLMIHPLLAATICLVAYAADPKVQSAMQQDASTNVEPVFERLDQDQNGYIDREEAMLLEGLAEAFAAADTNEDGRLDLAELSRFAARTPAPERSALEQP